MGRAVIVGGGTAGRYTIALDVGEARRQTLIAAATQHLAQVQGDLNEATSDLNFATVEADDTLADLLVAEEAYIAAVNEYGPTDIRAGDALVVHNKLLGVYAKLSAKVGELRRHAHTLALILAQAQARLARWQSLITTQTRDAWCADLTETASGPVATVEIPGESNLVLIRPGAPAPTEADGVLLSRELMSPEQAYFNAAILPGWQKHKPTYRWGTMTAINYGSDTADVALAHAVSSAQGLGVNAETTLRGVPVVYMTCNAGAFEVGDRVVVRFANQDWQSPQVIGFLDNPKPCEPWPDVLVDFWRVRSVNIPPQESAKVWFSYIIGESEYQKVNFYEAPNSYPVGDLWAVTTEYLNPRFNPTQDAAGFSISHSLPSITHWGNSAITAHEQTPATASPTVFIVLENNTFYARSREYTEVTGTNWDYYYDPPGSLTRAWYSTDVTAYRYTATGLPYNHWEAVQVYTQTALGNIPPPPPIQVTFGSQTRNYQVVGFLPGSPVVLRYRAV